MKKFLALLTLGIFIMHPQTYSHEGHDHGAASFQPPKGGILNSSLHGYFELITKDNGLVEIYLYNEKGEALPTNGLTVKAELELPRKKSSPIAVKTEKTHWSIEVDAQSAHRYTLKFYAESKKNKDYVKFTVERH